jgi:hypothetical protein
MIGKSNIVPPFALCVSFCSIPLPALTAPVCATLNPGDWIRWEEKKEQKVAKDAKRRENNGHTP